jgi:ABC-type cobalamin/Fe3+-siderophores transport system ATPase subunit
MLIKEGTILNIGSPENVLTRDLLKKAFDVGVDIRKDETGGTYINYENNL